MSDQEQIASVHFQRLNLTELKLQAQRWANQYPSVPIERIELYRYSSKFKKYLKGKPTIKYAIIFFVLSAGELFELAAHHYNLTLGDLSFCEISKIWVWYKDAFRELVSDTEYYQTGPELMPFRAFMDADFELVYFQPRENDHKYEWIIIPIIYDDQLPLSVKSEPHLVLYPDNDIEHKKTGEIHTVQRKTDNVAQDDKIVAMINDTCHEIEILYSSIQRIPEPKANAPDLWKQSVLSKYDKNKDKFKSIKRRFLEDKKFYAFSRTNKKRDFIGGIIQKIIEDQNLVLGGITPGISRLHDIYKRICMDELK